MIRPKSLYIEAVSVDEDGTEHVYRMKFERDGDDSDLAISIDHEAVDEITDLPFKSMKPTGRHTVQVKFANCRIVDA